MWPEESGREMIVIGLRLHLFVVRALLHQEQTWPRTRGSRHRTRSGRLSA
jgi:hypothetical protein